MFKKKESKHIFVWFYFHLTRFLLLDRFTPLVDWIASTESKSKNQSSRYYLHLNSFKTSFIQKFPIVVDLTKKDLSDSVELEDSSTYLTPLSLLAPIDSFASNLPEQLI